MAKESERDGLEVELVEPTENRVSLVKALNLPMGIWSTVIA